ncbi:hypothetical protein DSO57_1018388 [Entomophthora muscae]|uniref:Uncharacterized protein n=1 Tax=Entomophthora muscae TaxID=34485 RepID=A0ACC2U2L1_9FUNG|nr:hypothetical protein DSO57_1018388 [Entomophthora muscae]
MLTLLDVATIGSLDFTEEIEPVFAFESIGVLKQVSQPIPESGWALIGEAGWAWKAMYTIGAMRTR